MLKISLLSAAAHLLTSSIGFFAKALGRSEGQNWI
jgi:hypothetical protein